MRAPFPYYGGKFRQAKEIVDMIPPHRIYVEPFFGSGVVYFKKGKPSGAKDIEVINDTNDNIINFFKVMKYRFVELLDFSQQFKYVNSRAIHHHFNKVIKDKNACEVERAFAIFYLLSTSFSAKIGGSWGYSLNKSSTPKIIGRIKNLELYGGRFEKTEIESNDALTVIKSRDSVETFYFVDPPYYNSDMGHYKGYTIDNFKDLLQVLSKVKGKFLLTSYDSDILQEYIKANGWNHKRVERHVSAKIRESFKVMEIFTWNY